MASRSSLPSRPSPRSLGRTSLRASPPPRAGQGHARRGTLRRRSTSRARSTPCTRSPRALTGAARLSHRRAGRGCSHARSTAATAVAAGRIPRITAECAELRSWSASALKGGQPKTTLTRRCLLAARPVSATAAERGLRAGSARREPRRALRARCRRAPDRDPRRPHAWRRQREAEREHAEETQEERHGEVPAVAGGRQVVGRLAMPSYQSTERRGLVTAGTAIPCRTGSHADPSLGSRRPALIARTP